MNCRSRQMIFNLTRALRAAWWALFHADDLTMLRWWLEEWQRTPAAERQRMKGTPEEWHRLLKDHNARRYLGTLPIK